VSNANVASSTRSPAVAPARPTSPRPTPGGHSPPEPDHPASRPTACACLRPRTPLQEAPCEHDRPPHWVGHTPVLARRRPRLLRHGGVGHHPPHTSRREQMGYHPETCLRGLSVRTRCLVGLCASLYDTHSH